ncbi:MAG: hypothetical protein IKD29_07685 [Lentisphaeria bacterium]|nr:hypothetical protein [Lentisphaeria bacterium]
MKTSKIILLFLLAAGMTVLTACSTCAEVQKEKSCAVKAPGKRIKVGYYIDDGSRSGGVHHIARMLYYSPQFEVTLIDGKDLRDGKLAGLDLFVIPGGSSEMQYIKMGEAGAEAVRKFVREGGAFYGICAGFHCAINKPTRLRLMPYEHIPGGYGNVADLSIDISEEGAKLLNVSPGRHVVRYSQGPIVRRGKSVGETFAKTLAVYKGNITPLTRRGVDMYDTPAIIYGEYGKGKVISTSFHPESYSTTRPIWQGCVYAVTGVKPVPVYPAKNLRPVRVAFFTAAVAGKNYLREMLELDRHPDIDVRFIAGGDFKSGALDHADVLVVPDGPEDNCKRSFVPNRYILKKFMDQGKMILASEKSFKFLPSHKNLKLIKLGSSYVNEVLKVK